tara:strand:- start:1586 stop:2023 length:438 start_codon:yes stop_codon:yes gene_type:complete
MSSKRENKIGTAFGYHEERVSDSEVKFGWIERPVRDLSKPYILSYGSKSKKASEEDVAWSKEAGVNAASLKDYKRYFLALTGEDPDSFIEKWDSELDKLEKHRVSINPKYRDGEGSFLLSLAKLIKEGKRFTQYGRVFKFISDDT